MKSRNVTYLVHYYYRGAPLPVVETYRYEFIPAVLSRSCCQEHVTAFMKYLASLVQEKVKETSSLGAPLAGKVVVDLSKDDGEDGLTWKIHRGMVLTSRIQAISVAPDCHARGSPSLVSETSNWFACVGRVFPLVKLNRLPQRWSWHSTTVSFRLESSTEKERCFMALLDGFALLLGNRVEETTPRSYRSRGGTNQRRCRTTSNFNIVYDLYTESITRS